MVGRVDSEQTKLHCGNILLYDYIRRKRNRSFLYRNLQRALDLHERELDQSEGASSIPPPGSEHRYRKDWRIPSLEMVKSAKATRSFLLQTKDFTLNSASGLGQRARRGPIKKKGPLFRIEVHVGITIWETTTGFSCVSKVDDQGTIIGMYTDRGKQVLLNMDEDFVAHLDDLLVPTDPDDIEGSKRVMGKKYQLSISVNFRYQADVHEVLSQMGMDTKKLKEDGPSRWVASWPDLFHCPNKNNSLPLYYTFDHGDRSEQRDLGLSLEVCMGWRTFRGGSVLATTNQQHILLDRQSPLLPEGKITQKRYEVVFVQLGRESTYHGLFCPYCPGRYPSLTMDKLRMHLESVHEHLKHTFKKMEESNDVVHWRIESSVADHKSETRASDKAPDPRDIQIVAPQKPFNQSQFLDKVNDDWQKEARLEKASKANPAKSLSQPLTIRRKHPDEVESRNKLTRKKYRVPKAPKNVTFFRTFSKRRLIEGEYISDSEDDVDTDWLRLKTEAQIDENENLSERASIFVKTFNKHIQRERLLDDVHMGDSLLRFARENRDWLAKEDLLVEFARKVEELSQDRIISNEVRQACLRIRREEEQKLSEEGTISEKAESPDITEEDDQKFATNITPPETPPSLPRLDRKVADMISYPLRIRARRNMDKGKARVTDDSQSTPKSIDSDGDVEMEDVKLVQEDEPEPATSLCLPYDECLCGEDVSAHSEPIIYCESDSCIRHNFHIACIMQHWHPKEEPDPKSGTWFCKDCQQDPSIDTGDKRWDSTQGVVETFIAYSRLCVFL